MALKINIFLAFIAHVNEDYVRDVGCPFIAHVCLEMHGFVQVGAIHRLRTEHLFGNIYSLYICLQRVTNNFIFGSKHDQTIAIVFGLLTV